MSSNEKVSCQNLLINEVLASNSSYDYDDFFQYEDWIEIYNSGSIVNLAEYYLSDDPDTLNKWMFPSSNPGLTTILPGGHLRIWCDNDPQQGEDHANFKISSEGETLFLVAQDGTTILDSITIGLQQNDISYGRTCDGCPDWQYFNTPTPEAPNADLLAPTATLFINEYQANNSTTVFDESFTYSAWIEIFNPNDFQVNLAQYTITWNGLSHIIENTAPYLTTIDANGFQIFWLDGSAEMGANHFGITPNADGSIQLFGPDEELVDEASWISSLEEDQSHGRVSDGSPTWVNFEIPTPRVTNALQIIPPANVIINEVQTDNFITFADDFNEFDDWIELFNPTNQPIDLAGYYLSDRLDLPQKWQFPTGVGDSTVINPGGYMMLFADENGSQGWNHLNFKLSALGEPLALRSPDGFTVADSLFIPGLSPDRSWGRTYDAAPTWINFFIPTPNASNGPVSIPSETNESIPVIYPNPALRGSIVNVSHAGKLLDVNGKEIMQWQAHESISLDISSGIYLVVWERLPAAAPTIQKLIIQ
ncbi:MAG: lamin tail domain-containing protein [Flavobacteriales bacterium]